MLVKGYLKIWYGLWIFAIIGSDYIQTSPHKIELISMNVV